MLNRHHNNNESPSACVHLAALFFLICTLAACHNNSTRQVTDDDSTALRVGVLPTQECLRLFYAQRIGMTDSLDIRLSLFRSIADIDTALISGSIDVALTDTARLNYLLQDSTITPLNIVAQAHDTLWLIASDSSKVRGAGGLNGKLVGMLRYSDAQTAANRLAKHAQYQEGDVYFIQVADISLRYKMLTSRLIDAAFLPHPYSDAAIAIGHNRIKLPVTDKLCQGVWVARDGNEKRFKPLQTLLNDTTQMQPDTLRSILTDVYQLSQQALDSLIH